MNNVTFRPATIDDAPFVALVMMEAVGMTVMETGTVPEERIVDLCRRTDTLYSYRNAIIALMDGTPVGGLISYEGKDYHDIKVHTFALVEDFIDFDPVEMDDETRPGEYYLDSAAVLPQHRGKGLGRKLIEHGVQLARKRGLLPILACEPHNTTAHHLYTSIGFHDDGALHIFGEDYLRMTFPAE